MPNSFAKSTAIEEQAETATITGILAKIPVIVAVSACSSMAVDFAKEFGICLIGFTRENKMTVYANPSFLETKIGV